MEQPPLILGRTVVVTVETYNDGTSMQVRTHANGKWSGFVPGRMDDHEALVASATERFQAALRESLADLQDEIQHTHGERR